MTAGEATSAMVAWMVINVVSTAVLVGAAYAAGRFDRRRREQRDLSHAQQRLAALTELLQPIADAVSGGNYQPRVTRGQLAQIALLVQHDGPDGDELAALERQFHPGQTQ